MAKLFLILFVILRPLFLTAQNCDCITQFTFIKNYYENNNPAYQKIKSDPNLSRAYSTGVQDLVIKTKNEKSSDRCFIWLEKYVTLLKDHHSGIDYNIKRLKIDFNSQQTIDSFKNTIAYKSFDVITVDTNEVFAKLSAKALSDVEGIYTNGGSITFGVLKNKNNHYSAVVLKKNKLLDIGHILMELKATEDPFRFNSTYHTGLLGFNFQKIYQTVEVKEGQIPGYGFYKVGSSTREKQPEYSFGSIDDQTNYLKLSSFDYSLKDKLNAFYRTIDSAITSKPYLIIDLRDNGGGSEECYLNLLPYVYTQPFKIDEVEVWVSPDNIKQYEKFQNQNTDLINRMKKVHNFSFIPQVENAIPEWAVTGTTNPQKIAILINRKTASSAENMITYCIQSSKVVTLGENTGGYLGYGNVMTTDTPCSNFTLRSTTTKYKNNSKYEFIGIAPMIKLPLRSDWIEAAKIALNDL
ncbi:MAG: S41 family peptidase [Chitinophagaceae bacterium]